MASGGVTTVADRLRGKRALVTGGSHGIGLAIAEGLAREGCRIAIFSRMPERLADADARLRPLGAEVVAIDLSPTLVGLAAERVPADLGGGRIDFRVGDMLDPSLGQFDHVVAMDSLIHYEPSDIVRVLAGIAPRTAHSILFTIAPRTPLLTLMHAVGRVFPRSDRAPAIVPVAAKHLTALVAAEPALAGWRPGRLHRVARGFYISEALEFVRS
ncbi:MAG: SDR family NAD(P)-dependent oxidoreductase [Methylacidiphilales bacterium]|nr:SDR family NAD(P)-dependent oxidoreductase [Candidatus Methylacidiphilales bacterium]